MIRFMDRICQRSDSEKPLIQRLVAYWPERSQVTHAVDLKWHLDQDLVDASRFAFFCTGIP